MSGIYNKPQSAQFLSNFELSALGYELNKIAIGKKDNCSFFNYTYFDTDVQSFDCLQQTSPNSLAWPTAINSKIDAFSLDSQEEKSPEKKETFRAIVKKSRPVSKITSDNSIAMSTVEAKVLVQEHPKEKSFQRSEKRIVNSPRQLPIRSKNIDMSSFLIKSQPDLDSDLSNDGSESVSSGVSGITIMKKNFPSIQVQPPPSRCSFCENNGEKVEIYLSHPLKDSLSRVVCPILRNFKCPKCGESGDYAHTNKYCPATQRKRKEIKIKTVLSDSN